MDKQQITGNAVEHYVKHLNGRPAIAFCTTVKHAEHVRDQFKSQGWRAESIDGKLSPAQRKERVEALGSGCLNVLTSCEIVSEGFDVPIVSGAILLRPTKSLTVYLQQVGRALRPKPDGGSAVILDHVGNIHRHGMPDEARAWSLDGKIKGPSKGPAQCSRCYIVKRSRPSCADPLCPANSPASSEDHIKEVDGELKPMQDPYAWAMGCDISFSEGEEFHRLIQLSEGRYERLRQIQQLRGYKSGWIFRIMQAMRKNRK
jgi:superfamily II DNA or RNA helicase